MLYVYNGTAWVPVGDITAITSTESRLVVTNGTSGDVSLSLDIATVVANGGTGLVTADLLYDYIVSLDAVTSVTAGTGISVTGTASDPIINNTDTGSAQNIFKNVAVSGQSTVVADSNNDTLTFAAGSNVTITTNATTDTITISSTNTNTTYQLDADTVSGGAVILLNGSDLSQDGVKILGTVNEVDVTSVGGEIFIGLPNDVVISGNLTVIGTTTTNNVETVSTSNGVIFEGNAADGNELTLLAGTLTADQVITLPDATGTIALTSDITGRTYATTITNTATITHGLNTRDIIVQLFDTVTYETIYADVVRTSTTTATITFASTPSNSVRVLVTKIG